MLSFFNFFSKPPSLKQLPLKRYRVDLPLNRLVLGVDNLHLDVHISPQAHNTVKRAIFLLIIKHSRTENFFEDYKKEICENEKKTLNHICTNVLLEGINKAKSESEVQIDFLGQASLAKLFLEEIKNQYEKLIANIEDINRTYELSQKHDPVEFFKLKEKLTEIKLNQKRIFLLVGEELFQVLADVNANNLRNIRESNFHSDHILPDNFFLISELAFLTRSLGALSSSGGGACSCSSSCSVIMAVKASYVAVRVSVVVVMKMAMNTTAMCTAPAVIMPNMTQRPLRSF